MRKILTLFTLIVAISCNKVQEPQDTPPTQQQQSTWEQETVSYDDIQEEPQEEVSTGPTEWIWDGSQFDTIYPGATLRITHIDGDKVYLTLSE